MRISLATTCVSPCIRFGYCCNLRYAEPMSSSSKALLHSCISGEKSLLIKAETKEALGPFITASITQSTQQQPPPNADAPVEMTLLLFLSLISFNSSHVWVLLFPSLQTQELFLYSLSVSCPLFYLSLVLVLFTELSEMFPI